MDRRMAAMCEEMPGDETSLEIRKQIEGDLVPSHLPRGADAIEFDPRSDAIRCQDAPPMVGRLVETCRGIGVE